MQNTKLTWAGVPVLCAIIIASGIYFGLHKDHPNPTVQTNPGTSSETAKRNQFGDLGIEDAQAVPYYTDSAPKAPSQTNSVIVYVTRTGECYHRASCSYLRSSRIPMELETAKQRYRPCSKCRPPQ